MASFTGLKNIGEDVLEYMMKHRPWPDEEMSAGLHDLDNVFPGIYGRHASDYKTFADDPRIDAQSLKVINAVRGNPEAMVDIYRAVPKGVRDFNTGDWVSISKNYAKQHGESVLNGDYDLIKAKARAADISEPGDSIAEQGYWGNPVIGKVTRGILPLFAAGGASAALTPSEAEASPLSKYTNLLGRFADSLDYNDLPKNWADNPEIVQAAGELYRDMGTESPFFKAWFGNSKVVDDAGKPRVLQHTTEGNADFDKNYNAIVKAPFEEFKNKYGGIYFRDINNTQDYERAFGGYFPYTYDVFFNANNLIDTTKPPKGTKSKINKIIRDSFTKEEKKEIKDANDLSSWNPVESFFDGEMYFDAGRPYQNYILEKLKKDFNADGIYFPDNLSPGEQSYSFVAFNPEQIKSTSNRGTFNPSDPNIYKALPFAAGGAGAAAALSPGEASASVPDQDYRARAIPADQYQWPADEPGYVNREPGLGTPLVDIADLVTAPIGAATTAGKALSVAAEPFIAYGMDKAGNWIGDKVNGLLGYFGWGE